MRNKNKAAYVAGGLLNNWVLTEYPCSLCSRVATYAHASSNHDVTLLTRYSMKGNQHRLQDIHRTLRRTGYQQRVAQLMCTCLSGTVCSACYKVGQCFQLLPLRSCTCVLAAFLCCIEGFLRPQHHFGTSRGGAATSSLLGMFACCARRRLLCLQAITLAPSTTPSMTAPRTLAVTMAPTVHPRTPAGNRAVCRSGPPSLY